MIGDRVPDIRPDERDAEVLDRGPGLLEDLVGKEPEQEGRPDGGGDGNALECDVAEPETPALEVRGRGLRCDRRHEEGASSGAAQPA